MTDLRNPPPYPIRWYCRVLATGELLTEPEVMSQTWYGARSQWMSLTGSGPDDIAVVQAEQIRRVSADWDAATTGAEP